MKPARRYILLGTAAIGGLLLPTGAGIYGLRSGMCANQPLAREPSPDGRQEAVVFVRDCGATTDFSTQVTLLRRGAKLGNTAGNLFIVDSDHGRAASGPGGGPSVSVQWISLDSLQIRFDGRARVFKQAALVSDVRVAYSPF